MTFGKAIKVMRKSALTRVGRTGWNGKGMYIYLDTFPNHDPCFVMKTAQGTLQPGWLASQADMLAKDWELVS
jgi:hypothetical protein